MNAAHLLSKFPRKERLRIEHKLQSMTGKRRERYVKWLEQGAPKAKDRLRGGQADGIPKRVFNAHELRMGTREESEEHTRSRAIGSEIARDHLIADDRYYSKQRKREQRGRKRRR